MNRERHPEGGLRLAQYSTRKLARGGKGFRATAGLLRALNSRAAPCLLITCCQVRCDLSDGLVIRYTGGSERARSIWMPVLCLVGQSRKRQGDAPCGGRKGRNRAATSTWR